LFSGIGSFEKSLERIGVDYELVGFSEIDKYAEKGYCLIHDVDKKLNLGDVQKINEKELPEFDLLVFGSPCTNISKSGNKKGLEGDQSKLFYDSARILNYCKPKYFIFENVDNLLTINKGEDWKIVKEHLELNYNKYYKIINAKDMEIPQSRKRLFVVGIRKDIEQKFKFPESNIDIKNKKELSDVLEPDAILPILHNIYGGFKETQPRIFNEYSPTIRTAKGGGHIPSVRTNDESKVEKRIQFTKTFSDLLESQVDPKYYLSQKERLYMNRETKDGRNHYDFQHYHDASNDTSHCLVANTYKGVPYNVLIDGRKCKFNFYDCDFIDDNDSCKMCVEGDCFQLNDNPTSGIRKLTALECFRLMDFDDEDCYKCKKNKISNTQMYKLCGNSIVVKVLEEIFKQLLI